jgi:hypothetical protein
MSYLVFCTFDLKNASSQDYQNAYADLAKVGLHKVVKADNGNDIVVPTTAVMGMMNGTSASQVSTDVRSRIQAMFNARRFKSEIFVVVGGDWAWTAGVTP